MEVKKLSAAEYDELTQTAVPLKERYGLPYVLLREDQLVLKHLYDRKWYSFATVYPYAKRFVHAAKKLEKLGINVPTIKDIYRVKSRGCHVLTYDLINGKTVRQLIDGGDTKEIKYFLNYTATLHELGIYFRDLHMKNVIKMSGGQYYLVDIVNVKCFRKPLTLARRAKNIAQIINQSRKIVLEYGQRNFAECYLNQLNYSRIQHYKFLNYLNRWLKPSLRFLTSEY